MKAWVIGIIIVVVLIAGVVIYNQSDKEVIPKGTSLNIVDDASSEKSIDITGFAFPQEPLTIKKGEKVTWKNKHSSPHTVTSISGTELKSDTLNKDQTYSHIFTQVGTYEYRCNFHDSMTGKIIVTE
ncbi:MAG: plastocyanin/azurin family copper-binding protein [Nanoarchaeota archaeon]|nr:plastocyanin/azurin family copper-binding protein [Nanoarchaeota archaeon]